MMIVSYITIKILLLCSIYIWVVNTIHFGKYIAGVNKEVTLHGGKTGHDHRLMINIDGNSHRCEYTGAYHNISTFTATIDNTRKLFYVLDDYTIIEMSISEPLYYFYDTKHRISEIAVIVNDIPRTLHEKDVYQRTVKFVNSLFPTASTFINYWTPIYTGYCKKTKDYRSWGISRAKQHGIALIHSEIWKDFVNRPTKLLNIFSPIYNPNYGEDVLLIFEADNICLLEDGCGEAILHNVAHMTSDLMYLGWCFPYSKTDAVIAPLCLHAYAVTHKAARSFAGNVDTCDIAVDEQIRRFCFEANFSWSNATYRIAEAEPNYHSPLFQGIITQNRNSSHELRLSNWKK